MHTTATTVEDYLAELPPERRAALEKVRQTILDHLPPGYEEAMAGSMIMYQVPLETYPETYNGKPLMYAALTSQKRHMSLYLIGVYADEEARAAFEAAYKATGKRMDMGKSCVRFKRLEDLPLELIGESIERYEVDAFIEQVEAARQGR